MARNQGVGWEGDLGMTLFFSRQQPDALKQPFLTKLEWETHPESIYWGNKSIIAQQGLYKLKFPSRLEGYFINQYLLALC